MEINNTIKIVLVEDNEDDIFFTKEAFAENKLTNDLLIFRDGGNAINYFKELQKSETQDKKPNLILLDLNLPKVNGLEILKYLKSASKLKKIPVIILTTSKSDKDIIQSYDLHANSYIQKPVDFDQLKKIVRLIDEFWFSIVSLPKDE